MNKLKLLFAILPALPGFIPVIERSNAKWSNLTFRAGGKFITELGVNPNQSQINIYKQEHCPSGETICVLAYKDGSYSPIHNLRGSRIPK
ncbi:hypothetical protein [Chitinophaga nivalis]|uniref:Uncharacterized protein n=1 Tax=Chitinophaga nivalis TaxID=2991709 RepID=A0ABT3IQE2_9BACT|nr:hypothetical protein [Chitinophaga nivalis]MCW3464116.1 hypothetical protein [Chitinophaga nivalis]MCW3486194.1 hypothetical protein [Chitinophaga nivalis]